MVNHGMLVCSFKLRRKRTKGDSDGDFVSLNDEFTFQGKKRYKNFFAMIEEFAEIHKENSKKAELMKVFSVEEGSIKKKETKTYTELCGIIKSGSYGIESNLTDVESNVINYSRKATDADVKDFLFYIYVPKTKTGKRIIKGLMIFETIGAYGVKSITYSYLKEYFSNQLELCFEPNSISTRAFFEKAFDMKRIKRITLVKNEVSNDDVDNLDITAGREEVTYIDPKVKKTWKDKFFKFLDGKDVDQVFEVDDEPYDDIKVCVGQDGHDRTVSLSRIDKVSMVEDIPDALYDENTSSRDEIVSYISDIAKSYAERMVFTYKE